MRDQLTKLFLHKSSWNEFVLPKFKFLEENVGSSLDVEKNQLLCTKLSVHIIFIGYSFLLHI